MSIKKATVRGTPEAKAWVILPDVHAPYHDKVVWYKVMQAIKSLEGRLAGIVLAGDFLDLYSLSAHNNNSLADLHDVRLSDEYHQSKPLIDELTEIADQYSARKVYMYGNHEDRYWRYLRQGDNAKVGSALMSPDEGLNLSSRGWEVIDDYLSGYFAITKDLLVVHGIWTTVHCAKKHVEMVGKSVIFGHTHRMQLFNDGSRIGANIGWLGDPYNKAFKAFRYAPDWSKRAWRQGFAVVNVHDNNFWLEMVSIHNKEFGFGNKFY
jgi:predicted phosphodiesterase